MTENTAQSLLDSLTSPKQVMDLSDEQLPLLAAELRKRIIDVVSKNGGHLAPSLGVVELTLALLHTFNMEQDKIVWDVGHQAYAYKLLTFLHVHLGGPWHGHGPRSGRRQGTCAGRHR